MLLIFSKGVNGRFISYLEKVVESYYLKDNNCYCWISCFFIKVLREGIGLYCCILGFKLVILFEYNVGGVTFNVVIGIRLL